MTPEAFIPIAITFFLALCVAWSLLMPFCEPSVAADDSADSAERRQSLALKKETALTELEELEEDRVTSRVTAAEYAATHEELAAEAGEYLRELETESARKGGTKQDVPRAKRKSTK